MRAICFGRVNIATATDLFRFGRTTLAAGVSASDASLTVTDATPFSPDMLPFELELGITTSGAPETVTVTGMNGPVFAIRRDSSQAVAHLIGSPIRAKFRFCGWILGVVGGLAGKAFFGTQRMTAGGPMGVIKEFGPAGAGEAGDTSQIFTGGNALELSDYALSVAVDGDGLYVTLWVT